MNEGRVNSVHSPQEFNDLLQTAKDSKKPVVIMFTATWCGPCRFISPSFVEISEKITDVIFVKVDVDEMKSVADDWEIKAMPTFMFLEEGKIVHKLFGASKVELEKKTKELAACA